jgi:hypothetical protein
MLTIFVTAFLLVSLVQSSLVFGSPSTIENQALVYIQNVTPINTEDYTFAFQNYRDSANSTNSDDFIQCVTYSLRDTKSRLTVDCVFSDGVPCALEMRIQSGTLTGDSSDSNLISITKGVVTEHAILSKQSSTELVTLLDMLNPQNNQSQVSTQNTTLNLGHAKVPRGIETVNGEPHVISGPAADATVFTWKNNHDLTDPSAIPLLIVTFRDGVFYSLHDNRHLLANSPNSVNANPRQSVNNSSIYGSIEFDLAEKVIALMAVVFVVLISIILFRRRQKLVKKL